jgi:biopolymer transport protein ExbD
MSRRRKRRQPPSDVQLNLAAMLDMAFQLLAFFTLTFQPTPIEGHFQLHMPPPQQALTNVEPPPDSAPPDDGMAETSAFVETLDLFVTADNVGQVTNIKVAQQDVVAGRLTTANIQKLNTSLRQVFNIQATPFDRIQLHVDRRLHYEELMKIVDVCTRQTLPDGSQMRQVGFMELANEPAP